MTRRAARVYNINGGPPPPAARRGENRNQAKEEKDMKIAIPFDGGKVAAHFGKTVQFRVYEAENGRILTAREETAGAAGHEALAAFLKELGVNAVVCGGIGDGAVAALENAGIGVCSGADGDADEAAERYLAGALASSGANCTHHHAAAHEEGCGCGHDDEDECGCGCGHDDEDECGCGCGHCGHHHAPLISGLNAGKTCRVHYRGTFNDGTQFDSSFDRGEPLQFVCGVGQMIPGFDAAVVNMRPGDKTDIHLMPEEAYGPKDPDMILRAKIADLPGSEGLAVGQRVYLSGPGGQPIPVTVTEKDTENITLDANHEMAGKELNFHIEMVEILPG